MKTRQFFPCKSDIFERSTAQTVRSIFMFYVSNESCGCELVLGETVLNIVLCQLSDTYFKMTVFRCSYPDCSNLYLSKARLEEHTGTHHQHHGLSQLSQQTNRQPDGRYSAKRERGLTSDNVENFVVMQRRARLMEMAKRRPLMDISNQV